MRNPNGLVDRLVDTMGRLTTAHSGVEGSAQYISQAYRFNEGTGESATTHARHKSAGIEFRLTRPRRALRSRRCSFAFGSAYPSHPLGGRPVSRLRASP